MAERNVLSGAKPRQRLLDVSCLNLSACFCELRGKNFGIQLGNGKKTRLSWLFCSFNVANVSSLSGNRKKRDLEIGKAIIHH